MIPRTSLGSSYAAAADYYLHDKGQRPPGGFDQVADYMLQDKGTRTSKRVGFTRMYNLEATDPYEAFREMADTVSRQSALKKAAGLKASGRKLEKPIYTLSLSWHPSEFPTAKQMIAAGRSALKAMGMLAHQVFMVQHTDTPHRHIHMIVNRVHPKTGIAHKLSNDRLILSQWASQYEKEHGKVFCVQREKNNAERAIAKKEKAQGKRRSAIVKDTSMTRRQWQKLKDAARFKEGVPDINADILRDEAEEKKRLLNTPEAELSHLAAAAQKVLSGEERLVFRPKGAKSNRSKAKIEAEIEQKAAAIKKQLQAQIDHETAMKIETLQPKDWQQKLASQLGPQVTKAWFADAQYQKNELIFPSRFKADYVKSNYLKGVEAALGKVTIKASSRAVEAPGMREKASISPAKDPRAEAFAQWEIEARNALQDRQNEERAALGDKQARQMLRTEARIERHYGKQRKADEKALKAVLEKRADKPSRAVDRTLEAEQVALQMNLSSSADRIQEIVAQDSRSFEAAWLDLNTRHAAESLSLNQRIADGLAAGYQIPSLSAEPSRGPGIDRSADPGWGRG